MEGDTRKTTRYTASDCRTFRGSTDRISRAIDRRGAGPMILEIQAVSAVVAEDRLRGETRADGGALDFVACPCGRRSHCRTATGG